MASNLGQFIVPVNKRRPYRYSYRGGSSCMEIIKKAFDRFKDDKLIERITASQLGPMWTSLMEFRYRSPSIYNILVRAVESENDDEMLFRFGDKTCRLGRREFALISGLSMKPLPQADGCTAQEQTSSLVAVPDLVTGDVNITEQRPFGGSLSNINQSMLENVLKSNTKSGVIFKVGLVYMIDWAFHGRKSSECVDPFLLRLVEDTDKFLSFPWGTHFWEISLGDWKNLVRILKEATKTDAPSKTPNTDIHGLVSVLLAWGCESLPESVRLKFAIRQNHDKPRILRWNHRDEKLKMKRTTNNFNGFVTGALGYLEADDYEVNLLRSSGLTDEEINTRPPLYPDPVVNEPDDVQPLPQTEADPSHSQVGPSQSFDSLESRIMERMEMLLTKNTERVQDMLSAVDQRVDSLRKDVDKLRVLVEIEIKKMKNELMGAMNAVLTSLRFDDNQGNQAFSYEQYLHEQEMDQQEMDRSKQHQNFNLASSPVMQASDIFTDHPPMNVDDVMRSADNLLNESAKAMVGEDSSQSAVAERVRKDKRPAVDADTSVIPQPKKQYTKRNTRSRPKKHIKGNTENFNWSLKKVKQFAESKSTMVIPGPYVDGTNDVMVDAEFFKKLLTDTMSIEAHLVDCYINLMIRRMAEYPDSYDKNARLLFTTFPIGITSQDQWDEDNLPYTLDIQNLNVTPQTTLYTAWYVSSHHWLAVSMSIASWNMNVYDCLAGTGNTTELVDTLNCWAMRMKAVLKKCNGVKDVAQMKDPKAPPFQVTMVGKSRINSGDSGICSLKHLEALISGGEISNVVEEDMMKYRQEMAIELYQQII